ncbi:MAG TPA: hypothetical protein PJ983_14650, partial [Flavobacteriales bacterium]|nr:hypothetical protein [Flavobacteriales bacterium]
QRLWRPARIILGAVTAVALLSFSAHNTNTTPVIELDVELVAPDGACFIDENAVREQVLNSTDAVIGAPIGMVDLAAIEAGLRRIGCVAHADVFHTLDGTLHVKVRQREPIVRVINADGSGFYIDSEGWTMPLSDAHSARVLVVTGAVTEPFAALPPTDLVGMEDSLRTSAHSDEIYQLAKVITADPLWNALFDHAQLNADASFDLFPRIGGQRVKVGRMSAGADDNAKDGAALLTSRLAKLRIFYEQVMPRSDWRLYSTIDTRFADQVICTRKPGSRIASGTH